MTVCIHVKSSEKAGKRFSLIMTFAEKALKTRSIKDSHRLQTKNVTPELSHRDKL